MLLGILTHRDDFQNRFKKSLEPIDNNITLLSGLIPPKIYCIK